MAGKTLDKRRRMGIIIGEKGDAAASGRPHELGNYMSYVSSQKPSLVGVAVFAFELLYPY